MLRIRRLTNNHIDKGFTVVEIIATLAIIAILASLSLPRFVNLDANAKQKALNSALSELNAREKLLWSKIRLSNRGWIDDETLFSQLDTDIGTNYNWSPHASITGGHLYYQDQNLELNRDPSTSSHPGNWTIK